MNVVEWVVGLYDERIRAGKSSTETAQEVKALVEEFGRLPELWKARGETLLHDLYHESITVARRQGMRASPTPHSTSEATSVQPQSEQRYFGEPRVAMAPLAEPDGIFYVMAYAGTKYLRYGEWKREEWELKRDEYALSADAAFRRKHACNRILERMVGDLTTEECISEEEFKRLAVVF